MKTGHLKSYAPQARKDFIAAVTARANLLGLSDNKGVLKVADAEVKNDIVMIAGRPWPVSVNAQRQQLIARIQRTSFAQTMEAAAYAWFNRMAALRYMELHDYLGHGRRVLSNPVGGLPEILTHALDLAEAGTLPGLMPDKVRELKLANQDAELYRQVLIAQCNALHTAMPFLFERLGDETELLLPENLLLTDSVVNKLVQSIPEEDWQNIEIVGWLYQFYISEKKDQVIGKVVKSEDIPAATQLFTPNWIVKYMVQNSLGAQWLATYPDSSIKADMAYYIEPAEQTDEVNAQLAAITPTTLNPEELTLIDPACGSGHILVEAYDLFKAIYLERGYQQREVPKLILEKNLFGLDIDERAAQLTGFALMMKGRADDRRLFERNLHLNVMALHNSAGFDAEVVANGVELVDYGLTPGDLTELKRLFEHATTFGSLIQVPERLVEKLAALLQLSQETSSDLFLAEQLKRLGQLVRQAEVSAAEFNTVVANPPYMGGKGMNALVKKFAKDNYLDSKSDLFSCFIERAYSLAAESGRIAMVTMQSWMFLSSFEKFRQRMLREKTILTMAQIGYNSFPSMNSKVAQATVFVLGNDILTNYLGAFTNLNNAPQSADKRKVFLAREPENQFSIASREFEKIPGSPIAYWVSDRVREVFESFPSMMKSAPTRQGLATGDNAQFLRYWFEVDLRDTCLESLENRLERAVFRWFPCNKGGEFRRWYGNNDYVVDWQNEGKKIKSFVDENGKQRSRPQNENYYFREGLTWSAITSSSLSMRHSPGSNMFETKGAMCFPSTHEILWPALGFTNSKLVNVFLSATSPTLDFHEGPVGNLPYKNEIESVNGVKFCVVASRKDWDAYERSWEFQGLHVLKASSDSKQTVELSYNTWITQNRDTIDEMKHLEEENNRLFISAYGLAGELTPDVPIDEITLTVNPAYRYSGDLTEEDLWTRFRTDTMQELVSYAIGCMMGRYSLDEPGLIYANAGNVGFDASRYKKFSADADGIVPLTTDLWFEDDAALRVREFLQAAWSAENLKQNMAWLAEGLGQKTSESPDETIRRYLADKFFKDHLQTYKKRPIYWLFSSGKQGAFQALVYLHRYNAGTLSRLRSEYVVPLTGKMQLRIEQLERDASAASSTTERNRANKQLERLRKHHMELLAYDEQLRHHADMRIELDLDDGVKVNYGKFGDLLAEVKAVVGKKDED